MLPKRLAMLLIDGFALMSYASIIEAFRAANILAARNLYEWTHVSVDGEPVRASNGASVIVDHRVGDQIDCDILFLFAGGDPTSFDDGRTFASLRKLASEGVMLAGISGGPFILAKAGLLDGHGATIHWDHQTAFAEQFHNVALLPDLYVIDRRRITCAGGTAGLDLAVELIEREHGTTFATKVGEWFISPEHRSANRPQRLGLRERYGVSNDKVLRALSSMERSIEEPVSREDLASSLAISVRQLERLFRSHLNAGVKAVYLSIRIHHAQALLRKTSMPVTEVAFACGFRSSSHFARTYKAQLGITPREEEGRRTGTRESW
jgi:transcriptional regulator GlxA family with amidase domain